VFSGHHYLEYNHVILRLCFYAEYKYGGIKKFKPFLLGVKA
jgi:hypothetical protein